MGSSSTKPLNLEVEKFVKESITQQQVVIFSKTFCPYCTMAKQVSFNFKLLKTKKL